MYDFITDPKFVRLKLYEFYSKVLSNEDQDSMTPKQIRLALKKREVCKFIDDNSCLLIFKKL